MNKDIVIGKESLHLSSSENLQYKQNRGFHTQFASLNSHDRSKCNVISCMVYICIILYRRSVTPRGASLAAYVNAHAPQYMQAHDWSKCNVISFQESYSDCHNLVFYVVQTNHDLYMLLSS